MWVIPLKTSKFINGMAWHLSLAGILFLAELWPSLQFVSLALGYARILPAYFASYWLLIADHLGICTKVSRVTRDMRVT